MKRFYITLVITAITVVTYALPVLAAGGGN